MKTVLHVLSAAFSGSTLLDALLDSQPQAAGLGEFAQLWEEKPPGIRRGPCHICGTAVHECSFWKDLGETNPYAFAFEKTHATVLVDTSKHPSRLTPVPREFAVKSVMLVKTPHEWASSVRAHNRMKGEPTSIEECFFHWTNLHGEILHHCQEGGFLIRYRDLTKRPESVLADLCMWAGIQFDPAPVRSGSFWRRKSHALAGNPAVIDQSNDRPLEMVGGREEWLGGKYLSPERWRQIRYDDSWESDLELRWECEKLYRDATPRLRSFLNRLGFGSPEQLARQVASDAR